MNKIKLGNKVKDLVSDFSGHAVQKITFLNGCIQYKVVGENVGDAQPSFKVDGQQLVVLDKGFEDAAVKCPIRTDIQLGNTIKNPITGFIGIATHLVDNIDGSSTYAMAGKTKPDKDGEPSSQTDFVAVNIAEKVDEGILEQLNKNTETISEEKKEKKTGGPSIFKVTSLKANSDKL